MRYMRPILLLLILGLLSGTQLSFAAEKQCEPTKSKADDTRSQSEALSKTTHSINLNGRTLKYEATAATIVLEHPDSGVKGRFFYVAYTLDDARAATRPVTFAFNGGPGASSAYLHMGLLGPKRVALNEDGTVPPPPVRLVENPETWLIFTDLVFIDPIGTGFSRPVSDEKKDRRAFWGVEQDAKTVAEFIRLYLAQNDRWLSPKFLVGESYGGVRAATLAHVLQSSDFGIDLTGIVFVSPVLEYAFTRGGDYNILPWTFLLPSYTAAAIHHRKSSVGSPEKAGLAAVLAEVENFATKEYMVGLFRGASLRQADREALHSKLAGYIGLSLELVNRHQGRVPFYVFTRELLRDRGLIAGVYDASVTRLDTEPGDPTFNSMADPTLEGLNWPFATAFNEYVRADLQFKTNLPYKLLNRNIIEAWDWTTGIGSKQGFVTTAGGLKLAMTLSPNLKVFIAHGYYDLVTPYFATKYVIDQMRLPDRLRSNITMRRYQSGHMIYTHRKAREQLSRDVREFYAACMP